MWTAKSLKETQSVDSIYQLMETPQAELNRAEVKKKQIHDKSFFHQHYYVATRVPTSFIKIILFIVLFIYLFLIFLYVIVFVFVLVWFFLFCYFFYFAI